MLFSLFICGRVWLLAYACVYVYECTVCLFVCWCISMPACVCACVCVCVSGSVCGIVTTPDTAVVEPQSDL